MPRNMIGGLAMVVLLAAPPLHGRGKPADAAMQALERRGAAIAQARRDADAYRFVRARRGRVLVTDDVAAAPANRALQFVAEHGGLLGLDGAERTAATIRVVGQPRDGSVLLQRQLDGLPVFGAYARVHLDARGVTGVHGDLMPGMRLKSGTRPAFDEAELRARLAAPAAAAGLVAGAAELLVYPRGLLRGERPQPVLAWAVEMVDGNGPRQRWFVDARRGGIVDRIDMRPTALRRRVYSPDYDPSNPDANVARDEDDAGPSSDLQVESLFRFSGQTYQLFASAGGIDAWDGQGGLMRSVLYPDAGGGAFWNGETAYFYRDFATDDVVGHEFAHGYTDNLSNLIYAYQPGALNEAFSDIFGEIVDLLNNEDGSGGGDNTQPAPDGQRWLAGEDVSSVQPSAIRDMWDPERFSAPARVGSDNYFCGAGDSGGVHINSGVANHGFAMLVDGKTFNGQTIPAIGLARATAIHLRAFSTYLTPTSGFVDYADALIAACDDLVGVEAPALSTTEANPPPSGEIISGADCDAVAIMLLATEMTAEPQRCEDQRVLDPEPQAFCAGADTVFSEDWEDGSFDGWTRDASPIGADWPGLEWIIIDDLPQGRFGRAAYATNYPQSRCSEDITGEYSLTSPVITAPAASDGLQLRFRHWLAIEPDYDGGQLQLSVDAGPFVAVPQDRYLFNPPNIELFPPEPGGSNTNPLAGEFAYSGWNAGTGDGSYGVTVVDLGGLVAPGQSFQLRFVMSMDFCFGATGWVIDEVQVHDCPQLDAPLMQAAVGYEDPDTDGAFQLRWQPPADATSAGRLQRAPAPCTPLLDDPADAPLMPGGNGTWVGGEQWVSASEPGGVDAGYYIANGTDQNEVLLLAEPITIPPGTTTLSFYTRQGIERGFDFGRVDVVAGAQVTRLRQYTGPPSAESSLDAVYTGRRRIDLSAFAGQSIRLRFVFTSDAVNDNEFYGWYIDDIRIDNNDFATLGDFDQAGAALNAQPVGEHCYRVASRYELPQGAALGPWSAPQQLAVASSAPPPPPPRPLPPVPPSSGRGGGAMSPFTLLAALVLFACRRRRAP